MAATERNEKVKTGDWISEMFPATYSILDPPDAESKRVVKRICPLDTERLTRVYERAVVTHAAAAREKEDIHSTREKISIVKPLGDKKLEKRSNEESVYEDADVEESKDLENVIWSKDELRELRAEFSRLRKENRAYKTERQHQLTMLERMTVANKNLEEKYAQQASKLQDAVKCNKRQEIAVRELECEVLRLSQMLRDTAELLKESRQTETTLRTQLTGHSNNTISLEQRVKQLEDEKRAREEYWRRKCTIEVEQVHEMSELERKGLLNEIRDVEEDLDVERQERSRDLRALSLLQRHFAALPQSQAVHPAQTDLHCVQTLDLLPQ